MDKAWASLSARRAWIEIVVRYRPTPKPVVALRKESVDRNKVRYPWTPLTSTSLSARRAWIEITQLVPITTSDVCRSPQGERG